jgi:NTP pyrophosphatase (non-canonical NTP hydrolase)
MTPEEFIKNAIRTAPSEYMHFSSNLVHPDIVHAWLGVTTECGESGDVVKKALIYGKEPDLINLDEEFGDKLWYIALYCFNRNISFEHLFDLVINKLRQRFPEAYSSDAAIRRDVDKERIVLEQTTLTREFVRQQRRSPKAGDRFKFGEQLYGYLYSVDDDKLAWRVVDGG